MNESIDIHVLYTAEDYARGAKYVQRRNFLIKYNFLIPLVVFTLALIWLYFLDSTKFVSAFSQNKNLILLFVPVVATPLLFLLSRRKFSFFVRRQYAKQIESSPALRQPQRITFDDDGIEGQTILSSGATKWDAVIEATETEDDFYFFTGKKFAMFVPKRVIDTKEQQDKLRGLLIERLGPRAGSLAINS